MAYTTRNFAWKACGWTFATTTCAIPLTYARSRLFILIIDRHARRTLRTHLPWLPEVATTFSCIFILLLICGKLVMCVCMCVCVCVLFRNYIGCKRQMVIEANRFLAESAMFLRALWVIFFSTCETCRVYKSWNKLLCLSFNWLWVNWKRQMIITLIWK